MRNEYWVALTLENPGLLFKLHEVEKGTPGFETIVVPKEGFSNNDDVHNAVMDFLRARDVNILNPGASIRLLKGALKHDDEI